MTTANLSRIERSKRDKLERIKRAARKLFGRKGFGGTTTREIAAAADIGAGTLFLYAGSKEDLLVLIFREEIGRVVNDAFATMPPRSILHQVLHLFDAMIEHHERDRGLARVFVKELPFVHDRRHGVAELMATMMAGIAGLIDQAKSCGELRQDVPSMRLAHSLFALYFFELQRWLGGDPIGRLRRDEALHAALRLQLETLRGERVAVASRKNPIRSFARIHRLPRKRSGEEAVNGRTHRA
jgi:AcrR family transcriptional regulator